MMPHVYLSHKEINMLMTCILTTKDVLWRVERVFGGGLFKELTADIEQLEAKLSKYRRGGG